MASEPIRYDECNTDTCPLDWYPDAMLEPGAVIKAQMRKRQLTTRDIARESANLEARDSQTFTTISKSLLHAAVKPGYINAKRPTPAFFNTLIQILWGGDWRAFDEAMNLAAAHTLRTHNDNIPTPTASVPHYLEGDTPKKQRQPRSLPAFPGTDFLITMRSHALSPTVGPHATLHCRSLEDSTLPLTSEHAGRAIIYRHRDDALHAAWLTNGPRLLIHGETQAMPPRSRIVGIAEWTAPLLAQPTAGDQPTPRTQRGNTGPEQVSITFPVPTDVRSQLRQAARESNTTQRSILANAIQDLLHQAERSLDVIPPSHLLERPRDNGNNPPISHSIPKTARDGLAQLADQLEAQRHESFHLKELALYALRRTLTPK